MNTPPPPPPPPQIERIPRAPQVNFVPPPPRHQAVDPIHVEVDRVESRCTWMPKIDFPHFEGIDAIIWLDK
jgi:hypothetical protein